MRERDIYIYIHQRAFKVFGGVCSLNFWPPKFPRNLLLSYSWATSAFLRDFWSQWRLTRPSQRKSLAIPCPSFPWSFRKYQRKPRKHQGIFWPCEPWKTLENKQKTPQKTKEISSKKNTKETTKTPRKRRTGFTIATLAALSSGDLRVVFPLTEPRKPPGRQSPKNALIFRSLVFGFSLVFCNQRISLVFRVFSAVFLCFSRVFIGVERG